MVHGGSNFGYSGTDNTDASYDYSAPIGETGQLHNLYYPSRRAAWFARTFSDLLAGSHNDPTLAKTDLPGLRVTTRTNPDLGSVVIIDKFAKGGEKPGAPEMPPDADAYKAPSEAKGIYSTKLKVGGVTLPSQGTINVVPAEPRTVLLNVPWTTNALFESICSNVLFRQTIGDTDFWVLYGAAGDTGEINLKFKQPGSTPQRIDFTFPTDLSFKEIDLDSGDHHHAKVLVMNKQLTDRTWFAQGKISVGPSFVTEDGFLEFPPAGGEATIFAPGGKYQVKAPAFTPSDLPVLTNWTWRDATSESAPDYPTAGWSQSQGPLPMGSDGFQNRYGWYRTTLHRETAGTVNLHLAGSSGQFVAFLNGHPADLSHLECKAGDNSLSIFTKIAPRAKLYAFTGAVLPTQVYRGIWGSISTEEPKKLDIAWKVIKDEKGEPGEFTKADFNDSAWEPVDPSGKLTVNKGTSWVRGTFTVSPDELDSFLWTFRFANADTVTYLNGTRLDYTMIQDVSKILVPGKNVILFELKSWKGDTGTLQVSLARNSPLQKAAWFFHGGLKDLEETAVVGRVLNWAEFLGKSPWQTGDPAVKNVPTLWRTTFSYHPPANGHETLGLITKGAGLKTGHVWLNGHNLGECPQKVPMYMPECWLKNGDNDLVIFDLYGNKPDKVTLSRIEAFSRIPAGSN
jgi:beta-galactosidase